MTSPHHPTFLNAHSRVILLWLLTVIWAILIFQLSSETFGASFTAWMLEQALRILRLHLLPDTFNALHNLIRKLAHFTEYAIFSLFLYDALEGSAPHAWRSRTAFWAVVAAGLYSLTDEYHQRFVPGRTASLRDSGIDTAGAILGVLLLYAHDRLFHAKSNQAAANSESMAEVAKGTAGE